MASEMDVDNPTPLLDFAALSRRLAGLRQEQDWTYEALAERTGLSVSYLSRVESGGRKPSLETLAILAQAYNVTLSELFEPENAPCVVIRGDDAPARKGNDLLYTLLSRRSRNTTMQAVRLAVTPQGITEYLHDGEEWLFVLSGRLHLIVGDEEHELKTGDAAHFDARVSHRFAAAIEGITEVLLVACVSRHPLMCSYL